MYRPISYSTDRNEFVFQYQLAMCAQKIIKVRTVENVYMVFHKNDFSSLHVLDSSY
jgi:hypothetical protein